MIERRYLPCYPRTMRRRLEVRAALRRMGLTPRSYRGPGDWLAEDPPRWRWPTFRVYFRVFDWEIDA